MKKFVRVKSVQPLSGFTVDIQFTDGSQREINLEPYLHGPIFDPIRNNLSEFRSMHVEGGTIAWDAIPNVGSSALCVLPHAAFKTF